MTHRSLLPLLFLTSLPAAALTPSPALSVGAGTPPAAAVPGPAMPATGDALAAASEPLLEVKPDCEGLQQQALAQADRGYQAASRKLWREALGLLREAGQSYGEIAQHCPAQKDDAVQRGQLVPLRQIPSQIEQRYPGRLLNAELQRGDPSIYVIDWLTPDGRKLTIRANAETGNIMGVSG